MAFWRCFVIIFKKGKLRGKQLVMDNASGCLRSKKKPFVTAFHVLLNSKGKASAIVLYGPRGSCTQRRHLETEQVVFGFLFE